MQRLGERLDQPADADLIDHLGELAGARRPDQIDGAGIGLDHRLGFAEIRLIAADHHRERAVLGAGLAARDRRVERAGAALCGGRMQLAGDAGRGRGVVDEHGAGPKRLKRAVWPERHRAEIVVIADAGEDEIGAVRGRGRGGRRCSAKLGDPGIGLGARAIEHRHRVAATRLEMTGHGKAHGAEPDPRDFAHGLTLRHCPA